MKHTNLLKRAALLIAVLIFAGSMSFTAVADEGNKFAENVDLDVVAFVSSGEADGLRSDPVSKYVEESLNINLYLTSVNESDWPSQLSAMMASGDLPDIFMLSDPTKQLPMLI